MDTQPPMNTDSETDRIAWGLAIFDDTLCRSCRLERELGLNTGKTKPVYWEGQLTDPQHQVHLVLCVMRILRYIIIDLCPGPQNPMQFTQSFTFLTAPSRLLISQHWDDEARALMAGRMATIFAQLGRSSTKHLFACIEIYYNLQSVLRESYNRAVSYTNV